MMKLIAVIAVALLVLSACVQNRPASNVASTPAPAPGPSPSVAPTPLLPQLRERLVLTITVEGGSDRKPKVSGETNLPDGTELMVGLEGKTGNFSGDDKTVVRGGRFTSSAFGPEGGLKPGQYVAEVTMPIPQVQPQPVRDVIGQDGENLRGPLVKRDGLGTTVEVRQSFQLDERGSAKGGTDKAHVAAAAAEASEVFRAVQELERSGRDMESLRRGYPNDLEKVRQCGELMRQRQPRARALCERAEGLPNPVSVYLGAAAGELVLCVSCSRSALQNCDRARSSLDDASKAIGRK